jgi:hypothetical protein
MISRGTACWLVHEVHRAVYAVAARHSAPCQHVGCGKPVDTVNHYSRVRTAACHKQGGSGCSHPLSASLAARPPVLTMCKPVARTERLQLTHSSACQACSGFSLLLRGNTAAPPAPAAAPPSAPTAAPLLSLTLAVRPRPAAPRPPHASRMCPNPAASPARPPCRAASKLLPCLLAAVAEAGLCGTSESSPADGTTARIFSSWLTTPAAFCSEASERQRLISRTSFNSSPAQGQPHA